MTLRVNSPGGDVFDGIAIMNTLRSHPARVTTHVDSLAASIASVIAMAGDRIVMQPHSQMMIHDAAGMCIGNATDMHEMAAMLDRQSDNIAAVYAERAGGTVADWRERMRAETWLSAEEAVAAGLADEVAPRRDTDKDKAPVENAWDLSIFRYAGREHAPAPVASAATPETPPVEPAAGPTPPERE
ncbi:head maturation protease, ClpP-related, partial [Streptosporangium sp. NPDC003464]